MKTFLIILLINFITAFTITYVYCLLKERNSLNNRLFRSFKKIFNKFEYEDWSEGSAIYVLRDQFNNIRYRYIIIGNFITIFNHLGERICSGKI